MNVNDLVGEKKPWKTPAGFWSWLRGNLRRSLWKSNPVKLDYIRKKRYKYPMGKPTKKNPNGMIWVAKCEMCDKRHKMGDIEVDHREPSGSLTKIEDILPFILKLAFVTEDHLRLLCKKCHRLVTLSQRKGLSLEDAELEQKVIAYLKMGIREQKEFLAAQGYVGGEVSNESKRRALFRRIVNDEFERRRDTPAGGEAVLSGDEHKDDSADS